MRLTALIAVALTACATAPAAAQLASYVDRDTRKVTAVTQDTPLPINPVLPATSVDRGAVVGTTAVTLIPANPARRGFSIQVQSTTASCYLSGQGSATADYHSLQVGPGGYFEPDHHVGSGAISIVCSAAATPVFAREW